MTYKNIAVIGCGAAGGLASILLTKKPYTGVKAFDIKEPFSTLSATGGGRCNITNSLKDIREFSKSYPRGEKFLLSVFSKFNQENTRKLFYDLGIETYVQDDGRVFPVSNSAFNTIKILRNHLNVPNFEHKKERVIDIIKKSTYFIIKTSSKEYKFDKVILSAGGKGNGHELAKRAGHNIMECRPALCALDIREKDFYALAGLCFENVKITAFYKNKKLQAITGGMLFSHGAITGPAVFNISSINAYIDFDDKYPLELNIKLMNKDRAEIEQIINLNMKKSIKNVFSMIISEKFVSLMLKINNIDGTKQSAQMKKTEKEILINSITNLKLHAVSRIKNSEIVTAGGIDLDEINNKTMESKLVDGLYCIGEILNIDGLTGGFNLQNCWSGAYICSLNI